MNETLKRSPLYSRHAALAARFVPFAGWDMPVQYAGVKQEHGAVRDAVGLFDVSHMGELFVEGPGARKQIDYLVTNDVGAMPVGRALYTVCCNEAGTILDDLIVYCLAAERFLIVCNASNRNKISTYFASECDGHCEFNDRSDEYALLALQGPAAVATLADLDAPGLTAMEPFGVTEATLAGVEAIVARTGYTGEDGFELFCAMGHAGALWDALMQAGAAHGIAPIGLGARDTLRLEARLSLYGNDIDETTNPIEAGLGWVVKPDKGAFVGREALVGIKQEKPSRRLVGFKMVGRGIARHGYPVVDGAGAPIGVVTSGAPGLSVGENIGLAYVPRALSKVGAQIAIEIRGKVIEAVVVKTPFYKRS